jgi:hypothetical protein
MQWEFGLLCGKVFPGVGGEFEEERGEQEVGQ